MYSVKWSQRHPGLLLFLIDLSGSMGYTDKGESMPRIDKVFSILYEVLNKMSMDNSSQDNDGSVNFKETFNVKVVGYNYQAFTNPPLFEGGCRDLSELLDKHWTHPEKLFDTESEAKPQYQTRTDLAFESATDIVREWIAAQSSSTVPAPIVIHITDGHPEDSRYPQGKIVDNSRRAAEALKAVATDDGNTILINIHIAPDNAEPLIFPCSVDETDPKRKFLFDISSAFTPDQVKAAAKMDLKATDGSRFMASNVSSPSELLRLIEFGSSISRGPALYETPFPG